jgi:putative ABC transport system ATP-binding protein
MIKTYITRTSKALRYKKKYIVYSLFYGLSTLVVPLGAQFLVNNLALSGIWLNMISFIILIGVGLAVSQLLRHSQVVLIEFTQREIFVNEIQRWKVFDDSEKSQYYFEIMDSMKSFAKAYASVIEISLVILFGLATILIFHPAFIFLVLIIILSLYYFYKLTLPAVRTSIAESNQKYEMFESILEGQGVSEEHIDQYLEAKSGHFRYIRRISFVVGFLTIFCQVIFLSLGCYLIQISQLSIGQLVSSEIILSGITMSLVKLPQTLESFYDFETSQYKIDKAMKGRHYE